MKEKSKLTQMEFAELIYASDKTVSKWEKLERLLMVRASLILNEK